MALFDKYPDCGEPLKPHKILAVLEGQIVEIYIYYVILILL